MSYCISYDQIPVKQERSQKKRSWKKGFTWAVAALCLGLLMVPEVRLWLLRLFLPGFGEDSLQALEALAGKISNGQSVGQAFQEFCVEVFSSLNG